MRAVAALSERRRCMPSNPLERLDTALFVVRALELESERLGRLGLDDARRRCDEERRYWSFAHALLGIAASPAFARTGTAGR
jgi:hypothetical protein